SVCPKKVCFVIPAIFCAGISWFYAQDSGIPLRSNRNDCFLGHTLIKLIPFRKIITDDEFNKKY
ncbi:hypothetical protein ISS22_17205, partial [candidate division KSB1 bacterium]|nr:hypothetical protein [candidate division KSB1 bacterium]